jgi:hypothetical protein
MAVPAVAQAAVVMPARGAEEQQERMALEYPAKMPPETSAAVHVMHLQQHSLKSMSAPLLLAVRYLS